LRLLFYGLTAEVAGHIIRVGHEPAIPHTIIALGSAGLVQGGELTKRFRSDAKGFCYAFEASPDLAVDRPLMYMYYEAYVLNYCSHDRIATFAIEVADATVTVHSGLREVLPGSTVLEYY
jgi:hypothetical protein